MELRKSSNLLTDFENKWNEYLFENMTSLCNLPKDLDVRCKRWAVFWIKPNITLQYIIPSTKIFCTSIKNVFVCLRGSQTTMIRFDIL